MSLVLFCSILVKIFDFSEIQFVFDGRTDGRMDGRTDRPTDGQTFLERYENASKNGDDGKKRCFLGDFFVKTRAWNEINRKPLMSKTSVGRIQLHLQITRSCGQIVASLMDTS